jgi:hypothetical protein
MPERVTKEERMISLVIEKAREATELLRESLYDNNRSPDKDEAKAITPTRPKAKKADAIKNQTRKDEGYGLGGEITEFKKAIENIIKNILPEDYDDNPVFNQERDRSLENAAIYEDTLKELDTLTQSFRRGQITEPEIIQRFTAALKTLQRAYQNPKKGERTQPLIPKRPENKYR